MHCSLYRQTKIENDTTQIKTTYCIIDNSNQLYHTIYYIIFFKQEKLKMDCLRCRAYTRQRLRKQDKGVEEMEKQVVEATKKLSVINGENKK